MADPAAATPNAETIYSTGFSPESINYGLNEESYLTPDQTKLARMIQGQFDASLARRDRELQRYSAPALSSFAEDEALARAMAIARSINMQEDPLGTGITTGAGGRLPSGGGGGGGGSAYRPGVGGTGSGTSRAPTGADAQTPSKWASILSGISSIAPLLLGKDWMGKLMDQGIFQTLYKAVVGEDSGGMYGAPQNMTQLIEQVRTDPTYLASNGGDQYYTEGGGVGGGGAPVGYYDENGYWNSGTDPDANIWGDTGGSNDWYTGYEDEGAPWDQSLWGAEEDMSGWQGGDWGASDWSDWGGSDWGDWGDGFSYW